MQQSTLKVISQALGLSISTVSRALKDHPDISDKTKQKAKELAKALDYEPNSNAVQLRTKKSNILGILVPTIGNFFYDSFVSSVEEEARDHGYSVLILQSREDVGIEEISLNILRKNMICGLFASITTGTEDLNHFDKLEQSGSPVIYFDRVPINVHCNKVCLADIEAARLAADAIAQKNKQYILGLFGHPHLSITQKRCASFKETIGRLSPKTMLAVEYTEDIYESKQMVLQYLKKKKKPDTIFCMGDLILMGAMSAIHELNLAVPKDVAIISISNGLIPTLYNPKITFIETSGYKLGKLAFAQMINAMKDNSIQQEVFVQSTLVAGGSL